MSTFAIENFGCRANRADADAIGESLERAGLAERATPQDAALVVLHTCAVTAAAERDARAAIRRITRTNPHARILVTGCYAQRAPDEVRRLPGVAAVIGNSHRGRIAEAARELLDLSMGDFVPLAALGAQPSSQALPRVLHSAYPAYGRETGSHCDEAALPSSTASYGRTRPVLKVQDGCDNRCSFCVIPETRGPSRSVPMAEALAAARSFAERGGQELVLSGINLGRWGADLRPRRTLAELVRALLEETALPRLRLSSIEPMDWGRTLLELLILYGTGEHPRLAPHAHLPLQSGADAVLRGMHRRYRPWHYAAKLAALHEALPHAALGADVMVGFPGETEALFEESLRFLEAQPLTYLHLFPFSARPRTSAEVLHRAAPVAPAIVQARMATLRALEQQKRLAFTTSFIGQTLSAVTLVGNTALSANFLPIALPPGTPANRLLSVPIASIKEGELYAARPGLTAGFGA